MHEFIKKAQQEKDLVDIVAYLDQPLCLIEELKVKLATYPAETRPFEITQIFIKCERIVSNYLPLILKRYCDLSFQYRNTQKIKDGQTARDILIHDIKRIVEEINLQDISFNQIVQSEFLVQNRFINESLTEKSLLKLESDAVLEVEFVDKFDFKGTLIENVDIFSKKNFVEAPSVTLPSFSPLKETPEIDAYKKVETLIAPSIEAKENIAPVKKDIVFVKKTPTPEKVENTHTVLDKIFPLLFFIIIMVPLFFLFCNVIESLSTPDPVVEHIIVGKSVITHTTTSIPHEIMTNEAGVTKDFSQLDASIQNTLKPVDYNKLNNSYFIDKIYPLYDTSQGMKIFVHGPDNTLTYYAHPVTFISKPHYYAIKVEQLTTSDCEKFNVSRKFFDYVAVDNNIVKPENSEKDFNTICRFNGYGHSNTVHQVELIHENLAVNPMPSTSPDSTKK